MARKIDEQAGVAVSDGIVKNAAPRQDVDEAISRAKGEMTMRMSGLIDIEVIAPPGYCPRNFNFNVTDKLAKRFQMLKDALHNGGVKFDDGNGTHHVDSDADVFRWWLASLEVL